MKKTNIIGASLAMLALPVVAQAQEFSIDAGIAANYVVEADSFDEDSVFGEGYIQGSYAGFFGGLWLSSLDGGADDYEMELYVGYGNELSNGLSYSVAATAYYLEDEYDDYYLTLGLGYGLTDSLSLGAGVEYYPDTEITDISASVEYAFSDAISAYVLLGTVDDSTGGDYNYAEVGASYGFSEGAAFSLLYEDDEFSDPLLSFILSYDFNVFGG
ncbi:MAG: hypothetical protein ACU0B7_02960 [Paracoccaceae bacterium]|uniref:hypothetical protein n=1 Tax=Seohaeicola saemankumensis TaxID=481181 RepID=UPI001E33F9AF|nr:hypothetical protein [Seohaeicola saemankumensis]MCD1626955.1 hypothetical protein [Seohaeicola saemankumensis]